MNTPRTASIFILVAAAVAVGAFFSLRHRQTSAPSSLASTPAETGGTTAPSDPVDDRPLAVILRSRAQWPLDVELTKEHTVAFQGGEMTLAVGRKLRATMLDDEGQLLMTIAETKFAVPFYDTNFLELVGAAETAPAPARQTIAIAPARPPPPRIDVAKRLADLKARFPLAEKRKASAWIHNAQVNRQNHARPNHSSERVDVVEVDFPHPDLYQKYRGWVTVATPESLPTVIQKLEDQLARDLADLRGHGSITNQSGNAQAYYSYQWLTGPLSSYLGQLKALAHAR